MNELALTLLQMIVIVVSGRAAAALLRHFGQPPVIGEVTAGILLGPSALGAVAPDLFARLFPAHSIPTLLALSQIGLVLFLFLVGLEFAPQLMRERRHDIVVISHTSIIVPFILGTALALYLYPRVADPGVSFRGFGLFLGISMSITAFPVLARILTERNLLRTRMGNTVIACAAVDDVTAWSILAFVVMIVRATSPMHFAVRMMLMLLYVFLMIYALRPLLERYLPRLASRARHESILALVLVLVLASAGATEVLGIHALFGAFLAGAIMPREGRLAETLIAHTRGVTTILFLPLFFAITGLRTNIGLLQGRSMWTCFGLILFAAIAGKFGGATLSAAAVGFSWRDASAIGALMNTRGLMEMVVLNIGLDIGVVSRPLFTMCVLMALVTTAMTTPIIDRLLHREIEAVPDKIEVLT
jgi:Kef-type K+ transport system membrane component KefB